MNAAKRQRAKPHTTPQVFLTVARAASALRAPPPVAAVEPTYHAARQNLILASITRFYGLQPRHPAPLLGKKLLDVGCGVAPLGCAMALAGADVTATDPDTQAIQAARIYAEAYGTPLQFLNVTAEHLLTSSDRYDVIMLLDVLAEHQAAGKLIWLMKQLLKPNGILVVGHTNHSFRAWPYHIFLSRIIHKRAKGNRVRFRSFHTPIRLAEMAAAAGMQHLGTDLLRYSLNGRKWKATSNRRLATRYLAYFRNASA